MEIMDDLLAAGFDGLHPIERIAGMDLAAVRRHVGSRIFLCGGIDVSQLLPFGRVADIRAECDRAVAGEPSPGSTTAVRSDAERPSDEESRTPTHYRSSWSEDRC